MFLALFSFVVCSLVNKHSVNKFKSHLSICATIKGDHENRSFFSSFKWKFSVLISKCFRTDYPLDSNFQGHTNLNPNSFWCCAPNPIQFYMKRITYYMSFGCDKRTINMKFICALFTVSVVQIVSETLIESTGVGWNFLSGSTYFRCNMWPNR